MKSTLKNLIKRAPYLKQLIEERDRYRTWVPPGHFYSPIADLEDIKRREDEIFLKNVSQIKGVELNTDGQLDLLDQFELLYRDLIFTEEKVDHNRYFLNNQSFGYTDGIVYYCMLRHLNPEKVIEIGSGYSSALMFDVNEKCLSGKIQSHLIEPYPELLKSLISADDQKRTIIIPKKLQEVDLELFQQLSDGDILFVDSTHVSKIDSDVNRIFFEILPSLKSGVYIHIHDIGWPFEYPKKWVFEGWAWNEAYLLRAFLQNNKSYKIVFFNDYLGNVFPDRLYSKMPLCKVCPGLSIWLQKVEGE